MSENKENEKAKVEVMMLQFYSIEELIPELREELQQLSVLNRQQSLKHYSAEASKIYKLTHSKKKVQELEARKKKKKEDHEDAEFATYQKWEIVKNRINKLKIIYTKLQKKIADGLKSLGIPKHEQEQMAKSAKRSSDSSLVDETMIGKLLEGGRKRRKSRRKIRKSRKKRKRRRKRSKTKKRRRRK